MENKCLILIVDADPNSWAEDGTNDPKVWKKLIHLLGLFSKISVMLEDRLHLIIIACYLNKIKIILDSKNLQSTNQIKSIESNYLLQIYKMTLDSLNSFIKDNFDPNSISETFNAHASTGKALCYYNKLYSKYIDSGSKSDIIILKSSPDDHMQYLSLINCAFGAQKINVSINGITMKKDSILLQQAAEITGGLYFKIDEINHVLNSLLSVIGLFDKDLFPTNNDNNNSKSGEIQFDHRASCFCHHKLISTGFACSVCFSIFCKKMPLCIICGTKFTPAAQLKS